MKAFRASRSAATVSAMPYPSQSSRSLREMFVNGITASDPAAAAEAPPETACAAGAPGRPGTWPATTDAATVKAAVSNETPARQRILMIGRFGGSRGRFVAPRGTPP